MPFFLLLNLPLGGNWRGRPRFSTRFPQRMTVDYVGLPSLGYTPGRKPLANARGSD
jgi:hypothetical protein